jgi:2-methylfumaryl-CoA isomerase
MAEAAASEDRFGLAASMEGIVHPSGYTYPAPGAAARFESLSRFPVAPSPRLGQHTDEVLSAVLALPDSEIARLHDRKLIAS